MERLGLDPLEAMIRIVLDDVLCSICRGAGMTKYQPGKEKLLERTCESCYGSGKQKISQPRVKGQDAHGVSAVQVPEAQGY